jgi:hypothetical protein
MNSYKLTLKIFILAFGLWGAATITSPASAEQMNLEDLVREVKVALLKVQQSTENDKLPPLASAELELNAVQSKDGKAKVSFLIVEIGGTVSNQVTHAVKLILAPPKSTSSSDVASVRLADALAESILASARAISSAKKGSPPLDAQELVVSVKFAIKRNGSGGVSICFPPFDVDGGVSVSTSAIQSITVRYKYK